jgi:hypothetical protein
MARWHRYDARAEMLICGHGRKELPPQLYRANVSQPVRPSENFPLGMLANGGPLRFDRQSPDFLFATSQAKFADTFWRMSGKLRS